MFEIKIKITTISSCLIGNQTESFSIGGVDQSTTIDENGKPIIHGEVLGKQLKMQVWIRFLFTASPEEPLMKILKLRLSVTDLLKSLFM